MAVILKQPVSYQWFQIEHRVFFLYFLWGWSHEMQYIDIQVTKGELDYDII